MSVEPAIAAEAAVQRWIAALETRHLRDLTFQEVARALRALSSCYVERRDRLATGAALEGRGKRAAFAVFYAPLHFLAVAHIAAALRLRLPPGSTLVDLGCGTGTAGAAWALASDPGVDIVGVDRSRWAVGEAEWTWRTLGVRGRAVHGDIDRLRLPRNPYALLAAFSVNELAPTARQRLLSRVLDAARGGRPVLVVEPLARAAAPWWDEWVQVLGGAGAEERLWRFPAALPDLVSRLDRAAGLDHRELTARSIAVPGAIGC